MRQPARGGTLTRIDVAIRERAHPRPGVHAPGRHADTEAPVDTFNEALDELARMYGHDVALSLATVAGERPNLRMVNAYYKGRAFYITTYALSHKMQEIAQNPHVALCHGLFIAHGRGVNLGNPLEAVNRELREELREVFCAFYARHVNEDDPHTCILRVDLDDAILCTADTRYVIDFARQSATREPFINDIIY